MFLENSRIDRKKIDSNHINVRVEKRKGDFTYPLGNWVLPLEIPSKVQKLWSNIT